MINNFNFLTIYVKFVKILKKSIFCPLTIKNNFIAAEDLERIVVIKNDEKLKVILPNEVIYLDINSIGSIDSLNIKQNIVNLIYSNIIKQIKNNIDIEVDNEQLIQL